MPSSEIIKPSFCRVDQRKGKSQPKWEEATHEKADPKTDDTKSEDEQQS